jgi:carbon monoxide dehydrogenase subunit G
MRIEETFAVPAPVEEVWDFITDPRKMASCIPSVESVVVLDDRRYEVVVKQKVGFISATFKIQTEVLEKQAPNRIVFSNKGKTIAGASGTLKSTDTITLQSAAARVTEVRVVSELTLGGQLAVLGAKLIEAKSKELFAEATANLKEKLGAAPPAEPAAEQRGTIWVRLKSLIQALKGLLFRRWMVKPEGPQN